MARKSSSSVIQRNGPAAARAAELQYTTDERAGFTRRRSGRSFRYLDTKGRFLRSKSEIARIRALAIPPAWSDVWICPHANGHLQATGRDARGRKQYRYHSDWRQVRDGSKFSRLIAFARALPTLRSRVQRDMARAGMTKGRVLGLLVNLLESTLVRIGNDEYARTNGSFGLTTLKDRHADVNGSRVRLSFRGKGGVMHAVDVKDRRIARLVRNCQELPGYRLFQYVDDQGVVQEVDSSDVNAYLREITGADFTAKDFRTWAGTILTIQELLQSDTPESERERKAMLAKAIKTTALRLGNTVAICKACYVHPAVSEAFLAGSLARSFRPRARQRRQQGWWEEAVLRFLKRCDPKCRRAG